MLAAFFAAALPAAQAADVKMVNGIAAVASNDVITYRDLQRSRRRAPAKACPKAANVSDAELRRQVLGQLTRPIAGGAGRPAQTCRHRCRNR